MSGEIYLVCHKCKKYVYVCKNSILETEFPQRHYIGCFIFSHSYSCDVPLEVWNESAMPPSLPKEGRTMYEVDYCYEDYVCDCLESPI